MKKLTQYDVEEFIRNTTGAFHLKDILVQMRLDPQEYGHLRVAMYRACQKKLAKPVRGKDGWYRAIDREYDFMNFKTKNPTGFFDISYPFGLEQYVKTPRRSVTVLGGSPQAGKTAFAHNLIALNVNKGYKIILWDSENSDAEVEDRLSKHSGYLDWPDDLVRSRSADFDDVIEPDALNIIDYLEAPENIWEIRTLLRNIRDKLGSGVAFINLQKPEGRDLPYGRDWAKQLPRSVFSMEKGVLKILKGKSWAKREVNPDGLSFSFKLVDGERFCNIVSLGKEFQRCLTQS